MTAASNEVAAAVPSGAGEPQAFAGSGGPTVGFSPPVVRVGTEFLVNTTTEGIQATPVTITLSNGDFVVIWEDYSSGDDDLRGQIFTAAGARVGGEFLINTVQTSTQTHARATALADGGFVVTWDDDSLTGPDTNGSAIRAQAFTANGARAGTEILVNTTTYNSQTLQKVTALSDGGFVVTWVDQSQYGAPDGDDVRAQVFTSAGAPVGTEILVNTTTSGTQDAPSITALSSGGFVVTWQDASASGDDASGYAVRAQVFTAAGAPVGSAFLVNTLTAFNQFGPQIVTLETGGFAVIWYTTADGTDFKAQVYTDAGTPVGTEFFVNTGAGSPSAPLVTALSNGGFAVVWQDTGGAGDASLSAVRAQAFTAAGDMIGSEILVNTTTAGAQSSGRITALSRAASPSGRRSSTPRGRKSAGSCWSTPSRPTTRSTRRSRPCRTAAS